MCRSAARASRASARVSRDSRPSSSTRKSRPATPGPNNNMTQAVYPSLAGKTVVVTGGGSGIGETIVEGFARQNSRVFFLDVAEEESEALAKRLGAAAQFLRCDVTNVEALRATLAGIEAKAG